MSGVHEVWIGNIPYETTEEALREHIATVVPPLNVRIRYDRETGQSKGFAFCELESVEACALAVKYLHGTLIEGRPIRMDFCSPEQAEYYRDRFSHGEAAEGPPSQNLDQVLLQQHSDRPLGGKERPPMGGYASATPTPQPSFLRVEVARVVQSLSAAQLFYILGHLQALVARSPVLARGLLRDNPSFCYAVLHALLICGLVDVPFQGIEDLEALTRINDARYHQQLRDAERLYEKQAQRLAPSRSASSTPPPQWSEGEPRGPVAPPPWRRVSQTGPASEKPSSTPIPPAEESLSALSGIIQSQPELLERLATMDLHALEGTLDLSEDDRAQIRRLKEVLAEYQMRSGT